jgi:hypothetical protein
MAERSEDQRAQNEVTHPSRREVIRVLGGTALLGPLVVSGCFSRDPLSPDDDSGPQLRLNAQANQGALPLILYVSGFTDLALTLGFINDDGTKDTEGLKQAYYASQKAALGRPWVDMNFVPDSKVVNGRTLTFSGTGAQDFDSDRNVIGCNADAIAALLQVCQDQGQRATIVSHSKGGQDVLHALITHPELWDPDELEKGCLPTASGWVAFTSNHFESGFKTSLPQGACRESGGFELPLEVFPDLPDPCPPDDCDSAYSNFPPGQPGSRARYMHNRKETIIRLLECVPTISLYGTYVPKNDIDADPDTPDIINSGALNITNKDIRKESQDDNRCGANDGLVPARAGQLPGAEVQRLPRDPVIKDPGGNRPDGYVRKCGVDHMAPAVDVKNPRRRFWTRSFRNQQTLTYINTVEAKPSCPIEVEIDIKPGGDPNSINCNNTKGVIAVAILTNDCFDATTVDHMTVTLEGASETHVDKKTGLPRRHEEDVTSDGRMDLVFHFRLSDADLGCSSTEARLEGLTFDGQPVFGVDSVRMVEGGNP